MVDMTFARDLVKLNYPDQYTNVSLAQLPEGLAAQFTEMYSAYAPDKTTTESPFTVVAEKGHFQSIITCRLARNGNGDLVVTWGSPQSWFTVQEDDVEFEVVEIDDAPAVVANLKGYTFFQFIVHRADIGKNKYTTDGIFNNIGTLKAGTRVKKLTELTLDTEYKVLNVEEKQFSKNSSYVLTLESPDGSKFPAFANAQFKRAFIDGMIGIGNSIIVTGLSDTATGHKSAKLAFS